MRLAYFLAVLFIAYILIGVYDNILDPDLSQWQKSADEASPKGVGSLFNIIIQPYVFNSNQWVRTLLISLGVLTGIMGAAAFATRSDIITLSGLAIFFMGLAAYPLISIWNFVTRNVGMHAGCVVGQPCLPANLIGSLTVGIFALFYTMTVIEWWFWRPTTQ
jgi:hypothetical protein